MRLRDIEFGSVLGASGVQGFFGEGYWFHKVWRPFGLDFRDVTFVAKTTTLERRAGNMPLDERVLRPREFYPPCIVVKPVKAAVLNAVGLSGPGAATLFEKRLWQKRENPFFISFMSVEETKEERLGELLKFVKLFSYHLPHFRTKPGLQLNFSCPNVGLHAEELVAEVGEALTIADHLDVPLMPKFNVLLSVEAAKKIAAHPACDGICVSNTIPWGSLSAIDWVGLFGSRTSPLAHFGGGGLSGKPLLPLLKQWLRRARTVGIEKPISAGGGILSKQDAWDVMLSGASSISIGSVAILRPWRVRGIVRRVKSWFR